MKQLLVILLFSLSTFISHHISAQDVGGKTLISQSRTTTANIGKADITINYHSPSVNGRKIFGGIVPFDFVVDGKEYPWRAGSNQRTSIEFSHDVAINDIALPAGKYGLVVLVSPKEWTMIFSSGQSWGAFNYDKNNDVLRIPVQTKQKPFQEWLSYEFHHPRSESVEVELRWEETAVSFTITTDATANILADLYKKEDKTTNDYLQLATWELERDQNQIDKGLKLVEKAIAKIADEERAVMRKVHTFSCNVMKADLLILDGQVQEGEKLKEEMFALASGFNMYYYALRKYSVENKKKEAFTLLQDAIRRHPNNFQNHMAMGEYHLQERNQAKATEHFKRAYEMAVEQESNWINYAQYLYLQNKLALAAGTN